MQYRNKNLRYFIVPVLGDFAQEFHVQNILEKKFQVTTSKMKPQITIRQIVSAQLWHNFNSDVIFFEIIKPFAPKFKRYILPASCWREMYKWGSDNW